MAAAAAEAKSQYSAIVLGATGNVGGRIVQLLIKNPRDGRAGRQTVPRVDEQSHVLEFPPRSPQESILTRSIVTFLL